MGLALVGGMGAATVYDEEPGGYEYADSGDPDVLYRRARALAARRAHLWSELFRYLMVSLLLLVFVTPIGWIVACLWGFSLWKRYSRLELIPRLEDRWTREALERQRSYHTYRRHRHHPHRKRLRPSHEHTGTSAESEPDPEREARSLVSRMGDDPRSALNRKQAREALEDLAREEGSARQEPTVSMARLLDRAIARVRSRLTSAGGTLRSRYDSAGYVCGNPAELERVLVNLLRHQLGALEKSATARRLLEVHLGENLAGTRVWIRIRHDGPPLEPEGLYKLLDDGPLESAEIDDGDLILTFDKRGATEAAGGAKPELI